MRADRRDFICYYCVNQLLNERNGVLYSQDIPLLKVSAKDHSIKGGLLHSRKIPINADNLYCKKHCPIVKKPHITERQFRHHMYCCHILPAENKKNPTATIQTMPQNIDQPLLNTTMLTTPQNINQTPSEPNEQYKHSITYILNKE